MKISMNICRRVVGLVVLAVFVVSAATSDEFARWTNTVRRVEVRSSKDGTLQPSWFWAPPEAAERPVPLFVATHTWSYDLNVLVHYWGPLDWCRENGWALLCPNFRGPNKTPQACGSDLAVQDVVDAVAWAKREVKIDADRIYMMGGSGGGHITLLLAGRHPLRCGRRCRPGQRECGPAVYPAYRQCRIRGCPCVLYEGRTGSGVQDGAGQLY